MLDEVVVKVGGERRREGAGGPSCSDVGEGAGRVGCVAAAVVAAAVVAAVIIVAAAGGHVVGTRGGAPLAAARSKVAKRKKEVNVDSYQRAAQLSSQIIGLYHIGLG